MTDLPEGSMLVQGREGVTFKRVDEPMPGYVLRHEPIPHPVGLMADPAQPEPDCQHDDGVCYDFFTPDEFSHRTLECKHCGRVFTGIGPGVLP